MMPNVVVGGFPNSGTSFLCHLIHEMGLSAGSEKYLKPADAHNRWGYWEHLPLRKICRELLPPNYKADKVNTIPEEPLPRDEFIAGKIALMAEIDGVEVYKENTLPLVYRSFPADTKFIVLERMPEECYKSPIHARQVPYRTPYLQFLVAYSYYFNLEVKFCTERNVLRLNYEYFGYFFDRCVEGISKYIGVELEERDYARLRKLWRPRV